MAIRFDLQKLDELANRLKEPVSLKIGILADKKNVRAGDDAFDNAAVGARHEYGGYVKERNIRLPKRSFLKMPLSQAFPEAFKRMNWYEKHDFEAMVKDKEDMRFYKKIAMLALRTIDTAFATGGFGKWKPSNMAWKKVHMTLIETVQLRRSITYKVIKK